MTVHNPKKGDELERVRLPFTSLENQVFTDRRLKKTDLMVYWALCFHADSGGKSFPSISLLCKESRCSQRSIYTSLKRLVGTGYIVVASRMDEAGDRTSNLYTIKGLRGVVQTGTHPLQSGTHGVVQSGMDGSANRYKELDPLNKTQKKEVEPSALPAEKVAKKTAKAAVPKPQGEHVRLTDMFFTLYTAKTGAAPPWGGKEGTLLRDDLSRLGAEKMTAAMQLFFGKAPAGVKEWAQSKGWDYAVGFHSQLPKIEAALAGERKSLSRVRVCPHCGTPRHSNSSECLECHKPFEEVRRAG